MLETRDVQCLVVVAVANCSTHAGLQHWNFGHRNCCASVERSMFWRRLNVADSDQCAGIYRLKHCLKVLELFFPEYEKCLKSLVFRSREPIKHLRCRPSKSSTISLFLQRLPRSASDSPLHCWQPSISGCWPSGVELRAAVGYVSGGLPH